MTGADEGKCWRWEVVTKGSGDEGKWWRREVVRKGSDDEGKWWRKGSGDEGKWWGREVVTMGSGEEGKWWRREVVRKGSGEEGKWWGREVVKKGSGDEGKWWRREVVKKGSGDEGKWWRREVVKKGSDDEGEWWRREVMMKGSGDEGKWWGREVVKKGSGEEGKWWRREVVTKGSGEEAGARNLVFFRVKWLQPAMKGASSVRRVRLGSFCARMVPPMCFARMLVHVCVVLCGSWSCGCRSHWNGCMNVAWAMLWGGSRSTKPCVFPCKVAAAGDERYLVCAAGAAGVVLCTNGSSYVFCKNACSCVRSSMRFLKLWLQIALEWLHECCMGYVVGRKPEHETLCFSV